MQRDELTDRNQDAALDPGGPLTVPGISHRFRRRRDSQLQDEDDVCPVFEHVVQGHDVGVLDLLQDVHLPLDLLSFHAAPAGPALPLLDELGGVFDAHLFVLTAFDDCELATADAKTEKKTLVQITGVRSESSLADHDGDTFHVLSVPPSRWRLIPDY